MPNIPYSQINSTVPENHFWRVKLNPIGLAHNSLIPRPMNVLVAIRVYLSEQ